MHRILDRVRLGRIATEAEAVTEVIRGAALCSICIAQKANVSPLTGLYALARIGQRMKITEGMARCDGCLEMKYTHRV
jgi:hypothetical protein